MKLTPRELDKLTLFTAAEVARRRLDRGVLLNVPEATALISWEIVEHARDGRTVAECLNLGRQVLDAGQVMDGVIERLAMIQVEATFPDGTKLVTVHDPIGPVEQSA